MLSRNDSGRYGIAEDPFGEHLGHSIVDSLYPVQPTADNHDVHGTCRGGCNGMCSTGGEPVRGSEEQSTREHAGRRHEHHAHGVPRAMCGAHAPCWHAALLGDGR